MVCGASKSNDRKYQRGASLMTRKKTRKDVFKTVLDRQLSRKGNCTFNRDKGVTKIGTYAYSVSYDTHDPLGPGLGTRFKERSPVREIIHAKDIIFALTDLGLCMAFDSVSRKRLCYMNTRPDELIQSAFYNQLDQSIVTISTLPLDKGGHHVLEIRTTNLEYIRRGQPEAGYRIFEGEDINIPGFVEFDDVNGKALTYSSILGRYTVWDIKNYTPMFSFRDTGIFDVKVSPGKLLVIRTVGPADSSVKLEVICLETGKVLHKLRTSFQPNVHVDVLELFGDNIMVKQRSKRLRMIDVSTGNEVEMKPHPNDKRLASYVFMALRREFLAVTKSSLISCNFQGRIKRFDGTTMTRSHQEQQQRKPTIDHLYLTRQQDVLIRSKTGSIVMSSLDSGRTLATIDPRDTDRRNAPVPRSKPLFLGGGGVKYEEQSALNTLSNQTALHFNEEANEIYTGDMFGKIHTWGYVGTADHSPKLNPDRMEEGV